MHMRFYGTPILLLFIAQLVKKWGPVLPYPLQVLWINDLWRI